MYWVLVYLKCLSKKTGKVFEIQSIPSYTKLKGIELNIANIYGEWETGMSDFGKMMDPDFKKCKIHF